MISFKQFIIKEYTRRELEQKSWDELCKMAYGVSRGDIIKLKPSEIKIKYKDDLVNPKAIFDCEIKKNGKCGMNWVKSVSFNEPIKVSLGINGKSTKEEWYLEDGHHRLFAAKKLNKPYIEAEVEQINLKAIEKLLGN